VPGTVETLYTVLPATEVAGAFMTALRDADYATAYDLFAPDLQAEFGTADAVGEWMVSNGIEPLAWAFTTDNVDGETLQLLGTATFPDDLELELEMVLIQVEGEWRVAGFHVR
jgi:hypothetical protein